MEKDIFMYTYESLCCPSETDTIHLINYSNTKFKKFKIVLCAFELQRQYNLLFWLKII